MRYGYWSREDISSLGAGIGAVRVIWLGHVIVISRTVGYEVCHAVKLSLVRRVNVLQVPTASLGVVCQAPGFILGLR